MKTLIAPSILSADMTRLGEEVESVLAAGADMIHFDVMDNHYVPNLTLGPLVCAALHKRLPDAVLDVHLMVSPVDPLIQSFAEAGARRIAIHPDAGVHTERSLALIQDLQCEAGLALNPGDGFDVLEWLQHRLDFVLIMTVNPGFGGQKLLPSCIAKIEQIHARYPSLPICIDGGVGISNIATLAQAGASQFVAGSAIFNTNNYAETISALRHALSSAP